MTRINCVPATELSRQHLVAEYRELPRIFKNVKYAITCGKTIEDYKDYDHYTLGEGHMKFFYTRLGYLTRRYTSLVTEMRRRGYAVKFPSLAAKTKGIPIGWFGDWEPEASSKELNRARIRERNEGKNNE